jgi:transcription-repair coupling factor (superfamily II helicase)
MVAKLNLVATHEGIYGCEQEDLMKRLLAEITNNYDFKQLKRHFDQGGQDLLTGVSGTQKAVAVAGLVADSNARTLVISYNNQQAFRLALDLQSFLGSDFVSFFPNNELLPHEEAYEPEVTAQRIETLGKILQAPKLVVVTSWQALQRKLISPSKFWEFTCQITIGQEIPLDEMIGKLIRMGYERVDQVQSIGQFSKRGDIVDIYPLDRQNPIRLEFFGDQVDSIRIFNVEDQISLYNQDRVIIFPAREGLWHQADFDRSQPEIITGLDRQIAALEDLGRVNESETLASRINEALERLAGGHQLPGADQFLPWIDSQLVSLLDYLPKARLILDEPLRGREALMAIENEKALTISNLLEKGVVLPKENEMFLAVKSIEAIIAKRKPWSLSLLAKTPKALEPEHVWTLPFKTPPVFHSKVEQLVTELNRWHKNGQTVVLAVAVKDKARRLREVLREQGITSVLVEAGAEPEFISRSVRIENADLESGFEWPTGKLVVLTELEIYGRQKKRFQAGFQQEGAKINAFTDLRMGDYVVHINHGIGRFMGLETLEIAGGHRDYLKIEYAGEDRLFVPTDQVNLLQKYIGVEEAPPKINKLGGSDWQKVKTRVKESIREMAEALLELYAQRGVVSGHAFGADTVWQMEFEDAFDYEETPDQLKATKEIKNDMESTKPMDRLLCGDVGYGKTEVAMRAAFKAMMDGKQVGVLVPTTILAQQHFLTFRERFAGFPVNIQAMSRFQSPREQTATLDGLLRGEVDLVIGTHRLLSNDVHFKDLGLLIVDEEQRFGVAHKEKIKELRKNIDVLTLTATPIPRTLHMSLAGIRDMSLITTPPPGRYPIRTHVMEFNEEVIREALQRELDRKGQIYFVYNRVETIDQMAGYIQRLVPEARIIIGHGQMDEDRLERVMVDFYQYEADILLSTTIIETGLDIPNVNTLIVYDADRFGLSQLYQLRGRVGRSNRIAHAYFTYRKEKALAEKAEKRLAAIREFTELGSGFKIAMRDLEIRGAGNLLGPEQHGQIASVGFELYCRLLEEAIREKKGEITPELPEPMIEIPVDAFIPPEYIPDSKQKVGLYKKIANAAGIQALDEIYHEVVDRFGDLPQTVLNLINLAKIKGLARETGLASLTQERHELVGKLHQGLTVNYEQILEILKKYRSGFRYQPGRPPVLKWKMTTHTAELLLTVIDTLTLLKS